MKAIIKKLIAALSLTITALTQSAALADTVYSTNASAMSGFDRGYTLLCIAAFASIIWLGVTTIRRTRYKAL